MCSDRNRLRVFSFKETVKPHFALALTRPPAPHVVSTSRWRFWQEDEQCIRRSNCSPRVSISNFAVGALLMTLGYPACLDYISSQFIQATQTIRRRIELNDASVRSDVRLVRWRNQFDPKEFARRVVG